MRQGGELDKVWHSDLREPTAAEYLRKLREGLLKAKSELRKVLSEQREKIIERETNVTTNFEIGEEVLMHIPYTEGGLSRKLTQRWVGPFIVAQRLANSKVYRLENGAGELVSRPVSVMRLKKDYSHTDRNQRVPKETNLGEGLELSRDGAVRRSMVGPEVELVFDEDMELVEPE